MSRKQLEKEKEQHKLGAQSSGFAVSPAESDAERQFANGKRLLKTWPDATGSVPRSAKNKGSTRKNRRKKAAEEEEGTAHIDVVLEYQSRSIRN